MAEGFLIPPNILLIISLLCRLGILALFLFLFRKTDWRLNLILSSVLILSTVAGVSGLVLFREGSPALFALACLAAAAGVCTGPALILYLRVFLIGRLFC